MYTSVPPNEEFGKESFWPIRSVGLLVISRFFDSYFDKPIIRNSQFDSQKPIVIRACELGDSAAIQDVN